MTQINKIRERIDVADVLRAIAIGAIFLLHSIEHFNFYRFPETDSVLLKFCNKAVWDSMFFTFAGKSYAIFALMFGFTFFLQRESRLKKGETFTWRFVWRLLLLLLWGNINAAFFTAEVLVLYALVGYVLLPIAPLKSKTILIIAVICMLQPYEWGKIIYAIMNPDYTLGVSASSTYFANAYKVLPDGTFWETLKMNLYDGQLASLAWAWNNGRFFQTASLFMLGYLMGRNNLFTDNEVTIKFHFKAVVIALVSFFMLNGLHSMITKEYIANPVILKSLALIVKSLSSFAFMTLLVSSIILIFYKTSYQTLLLKLAPYGKMTLTNYITQSMIGSLLYYGWGFALYKHLGIAASFLLGVVLLIGQYHLSVWWMSKHRYGPFEYIWHKATWISFKK